MGDGFGRIATAGWATGCGFPAQPAKIATAMADPARITPRRRPALVRGAGESFWRMLPVSATGRKLKGKTLPGKMNLFAVGGVRRGPLRGGMCEARKLLHPVRMTLSFPSPVRLAALACLTALVSCTNTTTTTVNDKSARSASTGAIQPPVPGSAVNWPGNIRRIAMLPIHTDKEISETQRDMDGVFRAELMKVLPFEVVEIPRSEMLVLTGREAVPSYERVPEQLIQALRAKYGADAVVFTDFTLFRPYRPLAIGVRSKIVNLSDMAILWMASGVLDSAEPSVADSAMLFGDTGLEMRYVSRTVPKGREREKASGNQIILQSPRLYAAFVANQAYESLKPQPVVVPR
jgi:hypothetical protein